MNILCIGNSFSRDAMRYLHQIAKADGVHINACNLFIGGCPLDVHYRNMLSEKRAYMLDVNGTETAFPVSLQDALLNRNWDYVSIQQASIKSPKIDTYEPYLSELCAFIKKYSPKAKLIIHETWAYENGSEKLGYEDHNAMFKDIAATYKQAAEQVCADLIVHSGRTLNTLMNHDVQPVYRDGFHASWGVGRYALGLNWYKTLTGNDVTNNTFSDFDEEISAETVSKIKECVMSL